MLTYTQDKLIERDRYDERAQSFLAAGKTAVGPNGSSAVPLAIRRPYIVYEEYIRKCVHSGKTALDVCCGTGQFSLIAAEAGAEATASDIAKHNLVITQQRAQRSNCRLHTIMADAEHLPFPDGSFDLVTCAGSLSYLDPERFLSEVHRLLRPSGWFVCVDSLNHNPIYRLNRYIQYLRGRRTKATLVRMPTLATLARLQETFEACESSFHGSASFLAPLYKLFIGEERTAYLLDRFDLRTPTMCRWAFKFVFRGRRKAD
jgi:SAM-dependent methyltransferase